jgi:hypothetical protein
LTARRRGFDAAGLGLLLFPQDLSFQEKRLGTLPEGAEFIYYVCAFRPGGRSVAFGAKIKGKETAFIGDAKGQDFDKVWHLRWSRTAGLLAYRAERSGRARAVVGAEPGEAFDDVGDPVPRPDGKGAASMAGLNGRRFLVMETREARSSAAPATSCSVPRVPESPTRRRSGCTGSSSSARRRARRTTAS